MALGQHFKTAARTKVEEEQTTFHPLYTVQGDGFPSRPGVGLTKSSCPPLAQDGNIYKVL